MRLRITAELRNGVIIGGAGGEHASLQVKHPLLRQWPTVVIKRGIVAIRHGQSVVKDIKLWHCCCAGATSSSGSARRCGGVSGRLASLVRARRAVGKRLPAAFQRVTASVVHPRRAQCASPLNTLREDASLQLTRGNAIRGTCEGALEAGIEGGIAHYRKSELGLGPRGK
eukprot:508045-Amphidinium_carterae.1